MNLFGRRASIKHAEYYLMLGSTWYIATSYGFVTTRIYFSILFSELAGLRTELFHTYLAYSVFFILSFLSILYLLRAT
jgi:hypothetical protein